MLAAALRAITGLVLVTISELGMLRAFGRDVRWNLHDWDEPRVR